MGTSTASVDRPQPCTPRPPAMIEKLALNLLVSWAGWTLANHRRNPVIIKTTAIARFSARHSDARNLVVATSIARYRALATPARGLSDKTAA